MDEAYSHQASSAGWWPGPAGKGSAFYAYMYPEPPGSVHQPRASERHIDHALGEFVLQYAEVVGSDDPDGTVPRLAGSDLCERRHAGRLGSARPRGRCRSVGARPADRSERSDELSWRGDPAASERSGRLITSLTSRTPLRRRPLAGLHRSRSYNLCGTLSSLDSQANSAGEPESDRLTLDEALISDIVCQSAAPSIGIKRVSSRGTGMRDSCRRARTHVLFNCRRSRVIARP
jgi:hypothetical protein